jgi:hypothetical protein
MKPILLKVFISSVLHGHFSEREALAEALCASGSADDWRFEMAAAASGPLVDSYLREVRGCDLFILLLKGCITEPVLKEYREAKNFGRPVLVFLDADALPDQGMQTFLNLELQERYRKYRGLPDLRREVERSLREELIQSYRGFVSEHHQRLPLVRARIGVVSGDAAMGNLFKGQCRDVCRQQSHSRVDLEIGRVEGDLATGDLSKDNSKP